MHLQTYLMLTTDRLRGQHTAEEIMSLKLLKLLRLTGAPHYAYTSIMDIFADTLASKIVTAGATFRQRDTDILQSDSVLKSCFRPLLRNT
jgi:hypothetical protein